jgi:hypothetical protein
MENREKAIEWYNKKNLHQKMLLEKKYNTILITDSNIERIYNMENKRNMYMCGDGDCPFGDICENFLSEQCYVCMYNTGATTRDFLVTDEDISEEEKDSHIVS